MFVPTTGRGHNLRGECVQPLGHAEECTLPLVIMACTGVAGHVGELV